MTHPIGESSDFDIFFVGFWRSMMRAPTSGNVALGRRTSRRRQLLNRSATSRVSSTCWRWSSPTGTSSVSYNKMSDGHEDRVVEQPDGRPTPAPVPASGRLLLELRHAAQLAERRNAVEDPRQLGVRAHVALHEQQRAVLVEAGRHEHRGDVAGQPLELGRVPGGRERVQVDDAEDRLVGIGRGGAGRGLRVDPAGDRAEVVAQLELAGGFDPGEDPRHEGARYRYAPVVAWAFALYHITVIPAG